jgi:hypothetical protein
MQKLKPTRRRMAESILVGMLVMTTTRKPAISFICVKAMETRLAR